jgi:hypothetical protein
MSIGGLFSGLACPCAIPFRIWHSRVDFPRTCDAATGDEVGRLRMRAAWIPLCDAASGDEVGRHRMRAA